MTYITSHIADPSTSPDPVLFRLGSLGLCDNESPKTPLVHCLRAAAVRSPKNPSELLSDEIYIQYSMSPVSNPLG